MPVFDFKNEPVDKAEAVITYTAFDSHNEVPSFENPLMVLDNKVKEWKHHSTGFFTNPNKRTSFEFEEEGGMISADILTIDSRFVHLLKWLGENRIKVRLSGKNTEAGYAVYKIREQAFGGGTKLSSEDGFLQFMIERLLQSNPPVSRNEEDDEFEENGDDMRITSIQSITDFLTCAGDTLPENIGLWARRILDEELYGMESVKQRIIETVIQINRTHTLPAYGLLIAGPAGTGKSQVAYAVARILKLPWTTLDMSSINDPEQLTGSSRVYANAKPGIIMEAFANSGQSNLVFIINELDKANAGKGNGNPADVLLTLLDNLGFTDNYMECMIPTFGVYPIATANDKSLISAPLMSRFAVIDLPDYSPEEKQIIFAKFALPKILRRMSMKEEECVVTKEAVKTVVELYSDTTGIRDLEQAAEHIAANALYRIEVDGVKEVVFDENEVRKLLG